MLVRLVYASRSATPIKKDLVHEILLKSRQNNLESGITGVLCACHGDVFMQAIEGGRVEVNRLYSKLLRDERHIDVTLLDYSEIIERRFFGWRMGHVDLDSLNRGLILKFSETPHLDPFALSGRVALALIEELMVSASIVGGG